MEDTLRLCEVAAREQRFHELARRPDADAPLLELAAEAHGLAEIALGVLERLLEPLHHAPADQRARELPPRIELTERLDALVRDAHRVVEPPQPTERVRDVLLRDRDRERVAHALADRERFLPEAEALLLGGDRRGDRRERRQRAPERWRQFRAERLTALFEWAKFSHHEPGPAMRDDAIDALVAVRDELRRSVDELVRA